MNQEEAQEKARSYSFAHHQTEWTYRVRDDKPTIIKPFGLQPWGIASRLLTAGVDGISFTGYEAPAQCLCEVIYSESSLTIKAKWIYRAWSGANKYLGGFPDGVRNRAWTALVADNGDLLVGRGEPKFYILREREDHEWDFRGEMPLPPTLSGQPRFVASATFVGKDLLTVEHGADYECEVVRYTHKSSGLEWEELNRSPVGKFRYGVALARHSGNQKAVTITAPSSKEPAGIYLGKERIIPGVRGTGLCPTARGGVFVTCNWLEGGGQFRGKPGTLTYFPPATFPKGMEWVR